MAKKSRGLNAGNRLKKSELKLDGKARNIPEE